MPSLVEDKDVFQGDVAILEALNLRDGQDAAAAINQAALLDNDVQSACHLLSYGRRGQFHTSPHHHGLQTREGVCRRVGMDGGQRTLVAGVHGLQHVQGLGPPHLAHHDAIGAHAQGVDHQVADGDLALSLFVRGAGLHAHHVGLTEP